MDEGLARLATGATDEHCSKVDKPLLGVIQHPSSMARDRRAALVAGCSQEPMDTNSTDSQRTIGSCCLFMRARADHGQRAFPEVPHATLARDRRR
jgi:hypothetical protein